MLSYKDGKLDLIDTPIANKVTNSKYLSDDVIVVEHNGVPWIKPKYSTNDNLIKYFQLENWEPMEKKEPEIMISDKNVVNLSKLKITSKTDTFNILLITYIKEVTDGQILTTNTKRLKHLISILEKKPEIPLPWKYVEDLLKYISSDKDVFFQWLMTDNGKNTFTKYINI